jgi:hypothetical protein
MKVVHAECARTAGHNDPLRALHIVRSQLSPIITSTIIRPEPRRR